MGITYFKRFRMEYDLQGELFALPRLRKDYTLLPWSESLLEDHIAVKFKSFCSEIDANVFPNLGMLEGCRRLMEDIAHRGTFVPQATWLVQYWPDHARRPEPCGTIQGLVDDGGVGALQNVGITPAHRGRGIGTCLLYQALAGFQRAGLERVFLEVTAQNLGAVRLYERLGFQHIKTVYKASEVATV